MVFHDAVFYEKEGIQVHIFRIFLAYVNVKEGLV